MKDILEKYPNNFEDLKGSEILPKKTFSDWLITFILVGTLAVIIFC